jgi:hypothetical protein
MARNYDRSQQKEKTMTMKKLLPKLGVTLFVCFLTGCASNTAAQSPASGSTVTLYKRVGGYDAIAAVTDDFIGRLAADPVSIPVAL